MPAAKAKAQKQKSQGSKAICFRALGQNRSMCCDACLPVCAPRTVSRELVQKHYKAHRKGEERAANHRIDIPTFQT